MLKVLDLAHLLLSEVIEAGDVAVDATMGNGYDTEFLSNLTEKVFAFDVQEQALSATRKRLLERDLLGRAQLILAGHEQLADYVKEPVKAVIFNLGYLPNSDKRVMTRSETTLAALSNLTEMLCVGGRIVLMIYSGHDRGAEKMALRDWASQLPQQDWHVLEIAPLNQIHNPPMLICLEKRR